MFLKSVRPCSAFCWALLSSMALGQSALNVELDRVADLSAAFESARVNVDHAVAKVLVMPEALAFHADGRAARPLLGGIEYRAGRKKKPGPFEPVRVLEREVTLTNNIAIVNELLGAARDVATDQKVVPRRRTVTWLNSDMGWHVAALHSSEYSPWEKSITAYEDQDVEAMPQANGIVFVGSSSIRGWKTLKEDFPDMNVIGRGFGGSQLIDSIMYSHRIVTKYQPRAVAVYAGDNDVAAGKSAQRVFDDFQELVATIHAASPSTKIGFIAIKPSIRRWNLWPQMRDANEMVRTFAEKNELVAFLDISRPMLGDDGLPKPELFVKDGLHMTRQGYEAWTNVVMPWAIDVLTEEPEKVVATP